MKWKGAEQSASIDVSSVNLYPGEFITVWMNRKGRFKERDALQVELRALPDGRLEIFTDPSAVIVRHYDDWYAEPSENHKGTPDEHP